MVPPMDRAAARHLMQWYLEAGVDETVGADPLDRFTAAPVPESAPVPASAPTVAPASARPSGPDAAPARPAPPSAPAPSRPAPPPRQDGPPPESQAAVKSACDLAAAARNLDDLRAALEGFDGCALKKTATNLVFGDGSPRAKVLLIGEAPGADEDRQGVPFVGPSGHLLDKMLTAIGLERGDVFISNTVFWRPPGNRTPTLGETAVCQPFVERLVELIDPPVLIALGGAAAKSLLGRTEAVGRLRGRWFPYATPRMAAPVQATVMFHPAYLLRSPGRKRDAWRDLLAIRDKLDAG
ncbi:MAG: uracil-DNA glycosylase [Rhodobacterales bacterium]|nr:uracil-DNA glycosylase [Rhodobacterales bacterium]